MSTDSLAEHEKRWAGLPTLRQAVGAQMPAADGDLSELDELQERVFDAIEDVFANGGLLEITYTRVTDDLIYRKLRNDAGFPFAFGFKYWPDDRAAEQIAYWRYELDRGEIV